ncbi:hypothetical protein D3C76_77830 [compost metagenome]
MTGEKIGGVLSSDFKPEPYPDSMGSMLSRHWRELDQNQKKPSLTTVITELPELPNQQWQDHVVERTPIDLFVPQVHQTWFVKLPGAASLTEVTISDVTPKTVELATRFNGKSRYIRTEVGFVEMKNA